MAKPKKVAKPVLPEPPPETKISPDRLRKALKDAGLAQSDLALLSGVNLRTISRLCTGTHPGSVSLVDAMRIADSLRADLYALCARSRPG